MKLLLDNHILLWWLSNSSQLAPAEIEVITNPDNIVLFRASLTIFN